MRFYLITTVAMRQSVYVYFAGFFKYPTASFSPPQDPRVEVDHLDAVADLLVAGQLPLVQRVRQIGHAPTGQVLPLRAGGRGRRYREVQRIETPALPRVPGGQPHVERVARPVGGDRDAEPAAIVLALQAEAAGLPLLPVPEAHQQELAALGELPGPPDPQHAAGHRARGRLHGVAPPLGQLHPCGVYGHPVGMGHQGGAHQLPERQLVGAHLTVVLLALGRVAQLHDDAELREEVRRDPHAEPLHELGGRLGVVHLLGAAAQAGPLAEEVVDGLGAIAVAGAVRYEDGHGVCWVDLRREYSRLFTNRMGLALRRAFSRPTPYQLNTREPACSDFALRRNPRMH